MSVLLPGGRVAGLPRSRGRVRAGVARRIALRLGAACASPTTSMPMLRAVPSICAHRGLDVVGVEVGHLDRRDLADLVARDAADRLALAAVARALVDPGRLAQQVRGRRGLEDERERAVLEDRDLGRDDLAGLVGGLLVVATW